MRTYRILGFSAAMHRIKTTKSFESSLNLKVGIAYIVDDCLIGPLMSHVKGVQTTHLNYQLPQSENPKSILIVRHGGFGDLMFLTPALKALRKKFPDAKIDVAAFPNFLPILQSNDNINRLVPCPIEELQLLSYDSVFWLEDVIEGNPEAKESHAVDVMAKALGVTVDDGEREMQYSVQESEKRDALRAFPKVEGKKRIGFQLEASAMIRNYPRYLWAEVALKLTALGHEVFLFGNPGSITENPNDKIKGVTNLTALEPAMSFRESCALLSTCDAFAGVDSALIHVAGALGIPSVGLYGPFPWQLRTAYAKSIRAISGIGACAGCQHHAYGQFQQFPEHGPCRQTGECEVMKSIPSARIASKIIELLG